MHWSNGVFAASNGIEVPLVYATASAALALTGPGAYSLDAALGLTTLWTPAVVVPALALAVVSAIVNLASRKAAPVEATA